MAEGECNCRDKENTHFWDKCYSSAGTRQELPRAAPAHCSATAPQWRHPQGPHCQAAGHRVPGRAQGPAWLSIAASVPALINGAGRAGTCHDHLCFQGGWQRGRWQGQAPQACLRRGGVDPARLVLGSQVRKERGRSEEGVRQLHPAIAGPCCRWAARVLGSKHTLP